MQCTWNTHDSLISSLKYDQMKSKLFQVLVVINFGVGFIWGDGWV